MDFKTDPDTDFKPIDALTRAQAESEIAALRAAIRHHDHLYYVLDRPEISDAVYDLLFRRLQRLEEAYPDLRSPDSPTLRVGGTPVDRLKKLPHAAPMLSLQAVLAPDEVAAFDQSVRRQAGDRRVVYALEPKFDGLSVEVVYADGRFEHGATRGNGEVGEEISHSLRAIGALPLQLQGARAYPQRLALRGEVFMPKARFLSLNQERVERAEEPFANPRNAAAGMVRQLDPKKVAGRALMLVFYDILAINGPRPQTHTEMLAWFGAWGLPVSPMHQSADSLAQIERYHQDLLERRDDLEFEIDGMVIKLDDLELRDRLGMRERNPRWALAWKFPPREEISRLEKIVVQVGRTGALTPVALLSPVDVGGVTVSRATLHNESEVRRKDLRAGDRVRVVRAGDVIPEVMERIERPGETRGPEFEMPQVCPVCGAQVVKEGASWFCPAGLSCPAQLVGHVVHYASRNAMDIAHLGERTARQLVERGLARDLSDLYQLSSETLQALDGFAERSAEQLRAAIQASLRPPLDRFVFALGIRHVGQRIARLLAQACGSLERLRQATPEALMAVPGIGPEIAASVAEFFGETHNREVLERLQRAGLDVQDAAPPAPDSARPLAGKSFVFTGELGSYSRPQAQERVERLGGRVIGSVSRKTDYLVVGDEPGSKLKQAVKHGVEVIDEERFKRLIGDE